MMFGWVSKEMYDAAENLRLDALRQTVASEVARVRESEAARERYDALKELHLQTRAELEASNAERKLMLDRIVQLSGQPALFERAAPVAPPQPPAPPASTIPGPAARASFDDVHQAARAAIKDGTFNLRGRVN